MQVDTLRAIPFSTFSMSDQYPIGIINYVARTKQTLVIEDATQKISNSFDNDAYLKAQNIRSVMCAPITKNNVFKGIIYLENRALSSVFNEERVKAVIIIASQMAMQLDMSKFSQILESEKKYRVLFGEMQMVKARLEGEKL